MSARTRGAAMLACLGLGAADLLVLNLSVLPQLEGSAATPAPLAVEPAHLLPFAQAAQEVTLGAVSIVDRDVAPVVEALALRPEPHEIILFAKGAHRVHRRFRKQLDDDLAVLAAAPSIVVIGHADPSGPADLNERLSAERASAVARYLRQSGIDAERIRVDFRGAREPRADGELRRVEIFIGGSP